MMGVWGTGIFQDDTACDLRDEYRDLIGNGTSGPEATRQILNNLASSVADPDEAGVVWLALAATQWKLGRLESEALTKALEVIDSGAGLNQWTPSSKDFTKRKLTLEKLRAQITSPQPPEKKIAKRVLCECDWNIGELVAFRLLSGKLVILRVIDHHSDIGGKYPVCEILNWIGDSVPGKEELKVLGIRASRSDYKHKISKIMIVGMKPKAAARLTRLDMKLEPAQKGFPFLEIDGVKAIKNCLGTTIVHWKYLDKHLQEWFLLE